MAGVSISGGTGAGPVPPTPDSYKASGQFFDPGGFGALTRYIADDGRGAMNAAPIAYPRNTDSTSIVLRLNVTINTSGVVTTLDLLKNGVATGVTQAIGAGVTGPFLLPGAIGYLAGVDTWDLRVSSPGGVPPSAVQISATIDFIP